LVRQGTRCCRTIAPVLGVVEYVGTHWDALASKRGSFARLERDKSCIVEAWLPQNILPSTTYPHLQLGKRSSVPTCVCQEASFSPSLAAPPRGGFEQALPLAASISRGVKAPPCPGGGNSVRPTTALRPEWATACVTSKTEPSFCWQSRYL
jgi:hypothetical protein